MRMWLFCSQSWWASGFLTGMREIPIDSGDCPQIFVSWFLLDCGSNRWNGLSGWMTNLVVVNLNIHWFLNSKPPIVQTSLKLLLPILEIKPSCQNQNIQQTILNNPSAFSVLVALNQQITRGCNITIYLSWTFGARQYQVSCRNMGKLRGIWTA